MARPKEFDTSRALDDAMGLFWERGYEATTVRDLSAHTGVAISSLYGTFGGKHAVYLAALARNRQVEYEQVRDLLALPGPLRPALAGIFSRLVTDLMADEARRGSFTLNAAVERGARDAAVSELLRGHLDDLVALFSDRLAQAQSVGEIGRRFPPDELARHLLVGLYSLGMIVKVYPDRARLEQSAALTLAVLDL